MDVLDETKVEKSNMALTLRRLMQVPLHRLKDYAKLISKVALRYPSVSCPTSKCHLLPYLFAHM